MAFKIEIEKEGEMQSQSFTFNVLSKPEGLVLWLTDYKIKAEGSKPRRWSHAGDNGTFLKRASITIPDDVLIDAKARLAAHITHC
jgi:hypothetical protein